MSEQGPQTLIEAVRHFTEYPKFFADKAKSEKWLRGIRWPKGEPRCPACDGEANPIVTRSTFQCRQCRKQFSLKTGTFMHDSSLPVSTWMTAVWAVVSGSVSGLALSKKLGITQKSAWLAMHKIKLAMQAPSFGVGPEELDAIMLATRLLAVPKKELDQQAAKYKRAKKKPKK